MEEQNRFASEASDFSRSDSPRPFEDVDPWQIWIASKGRRSWAARGRLLVRPEGLQLYLRNVVANVPRYSALRGKKIESIDCFPLIARTEVGERSEQFLSRLFLNQSSRVMKRTSGTTGSPLTVRFDFAGWYASNFGGYATLARLLPDLVVNARPNHLGVALISSKPGKTPLRSVLPDWQYCIFQLFPISPQQRMSSRTQLRSAHGFVLHGKPSNLMALLHLDMSERSGRIQPSAILVSGETLFPDQRADLESWFRCPLYDLYTSTEGGIMACECRFHQGLHVLRERCLLEVLSDQGVLKDQGSGEIVVTNLTNWGMAFLRYRTGDIGTIRYVECACGYEGPTLVELPGKQKQTYTTLQGLCATTALDVLSLAAREFRVRQLSQGSFSVEWRPKAGVSEVAFIKIAQDAFSRTFGDVDVQFQKLKQVYKPGGKQLRYI